VLRRQDVEARTGVPGSSLYEMMGKGAFPRPIKLSARRCGWLEHEIEDWIRDRIAAGRSPIGGREVA
jgi:prophage regulatory protein